MRRDLFLLLLLGLVLAIFLLESPKSKKSVFPTEVTQRAITNTPAVALNDTSTNFVPSVPSIMPVQAQSEADTLDAIQPDVTNSSTTIFEEAANDKQSELLRRLREWATIDPEQALAEVLTLPDCAERNQALAVVCHGVAKTDPVAAIEIAKRLNLDQHLGGVVSSLVQEWAAVDLLPALSWVENQPASDQRNDLIMRVAFVLSQSQPANAEILVLNQIPAGIAQNQAVLTVLDQWADQDVNEAIAWVNEFPAGPLRNEALDDLQHKRSLAQ